MGIFSKNKQNIGGARGGGPGDRTSRLVRRCADIYAGRPDWASDADGVFTVNFARTVCAETARLALLGTRLAVSGDGARAAWLRASLGDFFPMLRRTVELACAYGTVILKPCGTAVGSCAVDVVTPDRFTVVGTEAGRPSAVVFRDVRRGDDGEVYERLEFHRYIGDVYAVSNRVLRGGVQVPLERSPFSALSADIRLTGMHRPLYAVLRMPSANNIDPASPLGLPVFADALAELRDLDVAVSRASREIRDSKRTVLIDSDRLLPIGKAARTANAAAPMPDFVRAVFGTGVGDLYREINPTLNTSERLLGIEAILHAIGVKCGFSGGYFTRERDRVGTMTATEVEANDRRTVEHIRDVRACVERALSCLADALDEYADLYRLAPPGAYTLLLDFGDVTYNREEDRRRWYEYVRDGRVPFEYYLQRFEGVLPEEVIGVDGAGTGK